MRTLGPRQRRVLKSLAHIQEWWPGCGWVWSNNYETDLVMRSLAARGLAEQLEPRGSYHRYKITENGMKEAKK